MIAQMAIDNRLLQTAFHVSGLQTPQETVSAALNEFIKKRKSDELIALFHSVDYDSSYDYKELRCRQ
jgi:Arc/MetJ family transcription regulator